MGSGAAFRGAPMTGGAAVGAAQEPMQVMP
jgi:hypothetical protein